jgi:hypothetical protein
MHIHHDLPGIDWQVGIIERPIELLLSLGFIGGIVVGGEVRVGQSVGSSDTCTGVEDEHALEQLDGCVNVSLCCR